MIRTKCFSRRLLSLLFLISISLSFILMENRPAQAEARGLSDTAVQERLNYIRGVLHDGQTASQIWWYGWISLYGGATAVQGGLSYAHRNDFERSRSSMYRKVKRPEFSQDMLIGGATTLIGFADLLFEPFVPAYAADKMSKIPENTAAERMMKLVESEKLLRQCAERERDGRGWLNHTLNFTVNAAAGVVTCTAFHRPFMDGFINFAIGEVVSLLNIFTMPTRAIGDWDRYESRYLKGSRQAQSDIPEYDVTYSVGISGFAATLHF